MLPAPPPKIYLVSCCYNEGRLLPFFLDYYANFVGVSRFFLYDGGSTDNTHEIIKDYPVEMFVHKTDKVDDRQLMHFRNEGYKAWRTECDWFIVCDIDEFLYHPNIHALLNSYKSQNITLPLVEGFEVLSKRFPVFKPRDFLPNYLRTGTPNPAYYNKHLIFDPVLDINYMLGCHQARPTGPVKMSERAELKNLHHKVLSLDYFHSKANMMRDRLSDWNKEIGAGFHYADHAKKSESEFLNYFVEADNIYEPVNQLIASNPLANFVANHLLRDSEEYRLLDLSNGGRYPSDIGKTFSLLQKKFGGQHFQPEHPPGTFNLSALRSLINLDTQCNTVYLDASMLKVEGLTFRESVNLLLMLLLAKSSTKKLLLLIDLAATAEHQRNELMGSEFLLSHFDLHRSESIVLASLKPTAVV